MTRDLLQRFWVERANCRGVDPIVFFPERGDTRTQRPARAICGGCEVRSECISYRLLTTSSHGDEGIWGGTTAMDRRELRHVFTINTRSTPTPDEISALVAAVHAHFNPEESVADAEDDVLLAETG